MGNAKIFYTFSPFGCQGRRPVLPSVSASLYEYESFHPNSAILELDVGERFEVHQPLNIFFLGYSEKLEQLQEESVQRWRN